jgi:hypothetical protein
VDNIYLFAAGDYMMQATHHIRHSTLQLIGEVDANGVPATFQNISLADNNTPLSLRNTTCLVKNMNITHNKDAVSTNEYDNVGVIRFVNCIISRSGTGCIVALANGGFVYFEGLTKTDFFFLFYFLYFLFLFLCFAFFQC